MTRAYNFSAGPAALPEEVLIQAREEMLEWGGARASVMEISHRGRDFVALAEESEADLRALMAIPSNYRVLFLQGGATQHFAQIPMNFARPDQVANYVVSGAWGEKAVREAKPYVQARISASSLDSGYTRIPPRDGWDLDADAAYVHYTPNETIHGVEFREIPEVGGMPLIADMSSDILSRPVDVSKFGLIYAGAQKNIGASGLVILIIREDLLERCPVNIARIFNYSEHAANHSLFNTPNTWGWYLASLVFKWLKAQGGVAALGERNRIKAERLYAAIDGSGFYTNPVSVEARSWMNVPFFLPRAELNPLFLEEADARNLIGLKGHKLLGGMRASIYNATSLAAVEALIDFMGDFARRHA
ncbi:MAG: 3-phosphoserine/phosphohydroxythreonine transaminase [Dokdonella sp.]|uniref:3-phosphoserine/phosphohydroxythreonine transaminase n=1 Tax=Dokdonella sp. TaxID=2291710 RepID=UPI002CDE23AB|nr:3-phosphoserine/phosphohydroxythreonine transaminase [Xanthomonadales bacterium]HQW75655.1 3-phosphoserine/phosphohydroxythreonine transaminase [Dokdonella sp.]MBK7211082.1 3-phosphoserine/phosphohydroxythreonine transaminase [Xanthomonadales bacterium]MBL0221739.1 3-phosphoserine/phosphohydroxythreonine transaminase [Xanthomonadales bacterium]HQX64194.1 3-phosphoserine/phosphohydroxythreonine transaminase [Dokdonella sp.]